MPKSSVRRVVLWVGPGVLAIFVAMQLVPYGWRHSNPSRQEVATLVAALGQMPEAGDDDGGSRGDDNSGRGGDDDGSGGDSGGDDS